jgi:hypothetical protein
MFQESRELPVTVTMPTGIGRYHALAEAMRWGAARTVEVHGPAFARDDEGRICATCAYGALAYGLCDGNDDEVANTMFRLSDESGEAMGNLMAEIANRFEYQGQSRSEIAAWLCKTGGCQHD